MERNPKPFLTALSERRITNTERAIALLWWSCLDGHAQGLTPKELAAEVEAAGYPAQNVTRLRRALEKDPRTAKVPPDRFRTRITAMAKLDETYGGLAQQRPIPKSDSVVPANLFEGTRAYLERVVRQANASFDLNLFDCCAVMCRRVLETLIIEAYEATGRKDEIRQKDGNYMMFSGLLSAVESPEGLSLSRNGLLGLKSFKRLGDLSAHNRRFNARRSDIERIRDGMRVAAEELLHIAGLLT